MTQSIFEKINEIKTRLGKATQWPWEVSIENGGSIFGDLNNPHHDEDYPYIGKIHGVTYKKGLNADAKLIANAPTDLDRLTRALEVAVEKLDKISRAQLGRIIYEVPHQWSEYAANEGLSEIETIMKEE